jgi:hypothetical protein
VLFAALDSLCNFNHPETKQRTPVNFGALATEEFGSIYESLLELHPVVEREPTPHFAFRQLAGNERKTTGSYYTPTSLVTCLLDSALDPVLEDRIQNFKSLGFKSVDEAVLALNVCDPACGSGHFLIAAAQRIARRLAILRAGDEEPSPELLRHTLREVIGDCIHGVDVNPMSVELCKVALWLEAVEPGKTLNFLDHHIKCGNSLLGATPECIRDGIPDKAYEPITGDNKEAAKWMRQLNKEAREGQSHFDFTNANPWQRLGNLPAAMANLETLDDETPEGLQTKEKMYREIIEGSGYESARLLHDTWCAAFVWPKQSREYGSELTTEHLRKIEGNPHSVAPSLKTKIRDLGAQYEFFHWHIEFPAVFGSEGKGGFDVILGNPPWEKINFKEEEFFAQTHPHIANAANKSKRKLLLTKLQIDEPQVYAAYEDEREKHERASVYFRYSGLFPLTGVSRINLYSVFCELALRILTPLGHCGLVLASGIVTDDNNKALFSSLIENQRLIHAWDFENSSGLFPGIHRSYKFMLLCVGGTKIRNLAADFAFYLTAIDQLSDPQRHFTLSAADLDLLNPVSHTCPTFRNKKEAEITKRIHRKVPAWISVDKSLEWPGQPKTPFNMANDSNLFIQKSGFLNMESNGKQYLPLYEGKLIHQFNHRFANFGDMESDGLSRFSPSELEDPTLSIESRYWLDAEILQERFPGAWYFTYRMISRATDERSSIAAIIPERPCGHTLSILEHLTPHNALFLLGCVNSFAFDFTARQKIAGISFNHSIWHQLPMPSLQVVKGPCPWTRAEDFRAWLSSYCLELTYTAWDLEPFAQACGFSGPPFRWDEERRFRLRCEQDAAFFHLFLGSDEEWRRQPESLTEYFPTPRDAVDYIMGTFPIVKRKDEENFGIYRTKDTILNIYDALAESQRTGRPYVSPLNPPPGPPTNEHGHFIPMSQWDPNHWPSHIHPPKEKGL